MTIGAGSPVPTLPPGEAERSPPLFLPDTATGRALDSGPAEALVRPPASSGIRSLSQREPILNVPGIVSLLCGAMILIHAVRQYVLDEDADREVLLTFAFIPARFEGSIAGTFFPGGVAGDIWTFVTYAFLHADWTHLGLNVLWFLVFGSAVARRFGAGRTLLFFIATAAAGALGHLAAVGTAFVPVIGASGAVSGFTAAALRFVFEMGGPLGAMRANGEEAYRMPALRLVDMVRNGPVMGMVVVWVIVNVAFGAMSLPMPGFEGKIAWQAHLAGFAAGLLLFRFFDPVRDEVLPA